MRKKAAIFALLLFCGSLLQHCAGANKEIPSYVLNVPFFYGNGDENQCMQIAMKSVIAYFLHETYTLEELDQITGRENGKWTSVSQGAFGLYQAGLQVEAFCDESERDLRVRYGKDADRIVKNLDMAAVREYSEKAVNHKLIKEKRLAFRRIEQYIEEGSVPIMIVDLNVLHNGWSWSYNGHSVVVTGFDEDSIYYHDPGRSEFWSEAHKKVSRELFIRAWNANGTDNCVIIVFGKRSPAG